MKVRYSGKSFGVDSLSDGKVYQVLAIEAGMLRIIDDSGEDYLYSAISPGPIAGELDGGKFEIVEDDATGSLKSIIK